MSKFNNKYRKDSARLKNWDYGCNGNYFVTICTKNRECYFGDIVPVTSNDLIIPNSAIVPIVSNSIITSNPHIVETQNFASLQSQSQQLQQSQQSQRSQQSKRSQQSHGSQQSDPFEKPYQHRYTQIGKIAFKYWNEIPNHFPFVDLDVFEIMPNHVHGIIVIKKKYFKNYELNSFGPQSQNLGSIIRGFKAAVKSYATSNKIEFKWQPRYHDTIIRDEKHLNNVRQYISNNPIKWLENEHFKNLIEFCNY